MKRCVVGFPFRSIHIHAECDRITPRGHTRVGRQGPEGSPAVNRDYNGAGIALSRIGNTDRNGVSRFLDDNGTLLVHGDDVRRATVVRPVGFRPEVRRHYAQHFALHRLDAGGRAGGLGVGNNRDIRIGRIGLHAARLAIRKDDISILRIHRIHSMLVYDLEIIIRVDGRIRIGRIDRFP